METRVVGGTWERWRQEFGDPEPVQNADGQRVRGQTYSIKLKEFTDENRLKMAYEFSNTVRREAQIADVWFINRGDAVIVYTGKYSRPNHPDAVEKLSAVRQAKIDDKRPFRKATLEPIDRSQATFDEFDLSQFSGQFTLLLAVYDRDYGNDFRAAVEDYADKLRAKHDIPIYYYHGSYQSLVTAGLFTERDFVSVDGADSYGPRIREMQERFPITKRNGEDLKNQETPDPNDFEKTVVVRVP